MQNSHEITNRSLRTLITLAVSTVDRDCEEQASSESKYLRSVLTQGLTCAQIGVDICMLLALCFVSFVIVLWDC